MTANRIYKWLVSSGVLSSVKKPGRYIGGELNIIRKAPEGKLRFLLAFPDTYEIGMSHLGLKLLYRYLNDSEEIYAERTYLPWKDMIEEMKKASVPLFSMETYSSASDFDILGITLQYELSYTNVLGILEMANIPLWQKDRVSEPLVVGGGPCTTNPEPVADFFDVFIIGDGEKATLELAKKVKENIELLKSGKRRELLKILSSLDGVYVPSIEDKKVVKAVISDLNDYAVDTTPLVPNMQTVHDRAVIEIMRGCNRGCRFCQAGFYYRPVRERKKEDVEKAVMNIINNTGYEELSFLSLSTMDYSKIEELTDSVLPFLSKKQVGLSLPSTRVDSFSIDIASKIASIRKTGLTFAPEAGTQRLRDVINKNINQEDLLKTVSSAIKNGWRRVKLYFMIGLPTETDEDIKGILDLAKKARNLGLKDLTVSVGIFVPKPHTPFQFVRQITPDEAWEKAGLLRGIRRFGKLEIHDGKKSYIEGVLARGDRKISTLIYEAFKNGAIFDEWTEEFSYSTWLTAMETCGIDPEVYTGERTTSEELPWDKVSLGVSKEFLIEEYQKALQGENTQDCRWQDCCGCGVCYELNVRNILNKESEH